MRSICAEKKLKTHLQSVDKETLIELYLQKVYDNNMDIELTKDLVVLLLEAWVENNQYNGLVRVNVLNKFCKKLEKSSANALLKKIVRDSEADEDWGC